MERPDQFRERETLSDQEVAEFVDERNVGRDRPPRPGDTGTYNAFWTDTGTLTNRTSMVVDPPDGRFPPLTPAGQDASSFRLKEGKAPPGKTGTSGSGASRAVGCPTRCFLVSTTTTR